MLDLTQETPEWTEIASMNHGRYRLALVAAGSHLYAIGGDGAFYNRNDVEVGLGYYVMVLNTLRSFIQKLISTIYLISSTVIYYLFVDL